MKIIAHIYNDYQDKFGIPRQSGLVSQAYGKIVFEKEYRVAEAVRGLEAYDYIWLIWQFSQNHEKPWSATVKPPRLGGKKRMGVFATRSPYRPNNIGLSSVRLERVDLDSPEGPVIYVSGADLLNATPIYDIKPYLAYTDAHVDAKEGFAADYVKQEVAVDFPKELQEILPETTREAVVEILKQDPRAGYEKKTQREYRLAYGGYDIVFFAMENQLVVKEVVKLCK